MKNLTKPVTDSTVFCARYIFRDTFPFVPVVAPANIYDGILIKPSGVKCFSPRFPDFQHSIDDYVEFINKHSLEKAMVIASDISFLEKCPTLKYLTVVPSDSADDNFDFSPLYKHPEIIYLRCHTEYGINFQRKSAVDYSKINGLINLHISGTGHFNCNYVQTLKTFSISEHGKENLYDVLGETKLDNLRIIDSSIKSLRGLERLKDLRILELSYNRKLEDISALEDASKTLKSLMIENCHKIKDFSVLEKLEHLEILILYGNNTLSDLSFLKKMKKLRIFAFNVAVLNGDLTPCLNIEHVFCARDRKYYNLKNPDLPKSNIDLDTIMYDGIEYWRRF